LVVDDGGFVVLSRGDGSRGGIFFLLDQIFLTGLEQFRVGRLLDLGIGLDRSVL
jgi:hypothetical protein